MAKKRLTLGDEIRAAVDGSGLSRYRICKVIEIDQGTFSKFMAGKVGLTLATLNKLAEALNLHITAGKPRITPTPENRRRNPQKNIRSK